MESKKLRRAVRGLTFTLDELNIGDKYSYIVDLRKNTVMLVPDEEGAITVSRKKSGKNYKPLIDIRSKEVRELVAAADYMMIEEEDGNIIVRFIKEVEGKSPLEGEELGSVQFTEDELKDNLRMMGKRVGNNTVYNVVSLFSGAGLLDHAFEDKHFRFIYAVDFDKDACETYRRNIGDHIECRDIREVDPGKIREKVDVIIGGPCCQSYSNSNRTNVSEEKRLLIDDYIRFVVEKNPLVFVIENVRQLLTAEKGKYFQRVKDALANDYNITAAVLNDSDVGGYSTRERAIIIGSLKSVLGKIKLPKCISLRPKTVGEALSKVTPDWENYRDVTEPKQTTIEAMRYVPQGGNFNDCPEEIRVKHGWKKNTHSNTFRRLSLTEPSITLTNWRKCCLTHPTENRILTVSEAAAIMGLEKDFPLSGSSLNAKQQQVGNGVTQAIGRFVRDCVLRHLLSMERR